MFVQAAEICTTTNDRAACYYLARQYENQNQIKEAITFFQKAKAYGSAIRLCKVNLCFLLEIYYNFFLLFRKN